MTTHTTTRIHLTIRDRLRAWLSQRDPIALLVLALALILTVAFLRPIASTPIAAAVPTPSLPIIMIATARAETMPTPTILTKAASVLPNTLVRAVVAYDSPNGSVIGAIERGRSYSLLARSGVDWLQADVTGSGVVWLRAADLFDLPTDLADLAPQLAPQVVYQVVNQPSQQPTLTADERYQALRREFGSEDITGGDALKAQQAREDAYADGSAREAAIRNHLANEHIPDSSEMPCHCP